MRSGSPFTSEAGVSLLEMLAALAIVAVMATVVVVTADFGDSPEDEAGARLVRALDEARREALLSGEIIGFSADPDGRGYRFFGYGEDAWMERRDHPALEPVRFSDPDLSLHLDAGGVSRRFGGDQGGESGARPSMQASTQASAPQVWFDPAGFDDPFAYALTGARGGAGIIRGDDGGLQFVAGPGEPGEAQP